MNDRRRGLTWGGFLLVVGTLALMFVVSLPFPSEDNVGFVLWYWLGWGSLGAFAGMSLVVGYVTRDLRSLWHLVVSAFTVICLGLWLGDQRFFGNASVNFLCSLAVIAALLKCCEVNRQFSPGVRAFARPITIVTALAVIVRLAAPPHCFLPLLNYPESNLAQARAAIVAVFLSAGAAAVCVGCVVVWLRRRRQEDPAEEIPFLERSISRPAGNRIVATVMAAVGTLVFLWYFVLGLCSMSGGVRYPHLRVHIGDRAVVVRSAIEYLTAHGARQTDLEYPDFHFQRTRNGPQLASFEYPLHFGRVMRLAIFPDSDSEDRVMISFDCSGVTALDMGMAGRFGNQMREDFFKQALEIRQARAGQ